MKKTLKIAAFVAAAMIGFGFVSCANDDAEDLGTLLIVKDYQEKKEAEAAAAAAAAKATENSSSNGSGSGTSTSAGIKFDATDTSTEIGAALAKLDSSSVAVNFTAGTYDGVTLTQTADGDLVKPKGDTSIQIKKNAATATFEVKNGAKITISASSSGKDKKTYYTVTGAASGDATVVNSGTFTDTSFTATSDGTVTITPTKFLSDGSTNNNNLRVQKITVTY